MPRKPPPRQYGQASLERAALHYLERFSSSAANLQRVLERKMRRRVPGGEEMPADAPAMIQAVIEKLKAQGWLNDEAYAEMKARSLHRRGASTRAIRQTLSLKGVAAETRDAALSAVEEEAGRDLDLAAAIALARRRRLGPFRRDGRHEHRDRDLAVLGRAGFPYDLARKVVDAEDEAVFEA